MSKGRRNDRRIARRVRHDMELAQKRRDRRLMRELLAAVAKTPLSDAQVAQVRVALLEAGENVAGARDPQGRWYPTGAGPAPQGQGVPAMPLPKAHH